MAIITKRDRSTRTQPKTVTRKKLVLSIVLGLSFLVLDVVLMVTDPVLIIARYVCRVDYGTLIHNALSEEFVGIHVAAYLFNVTNADRFQAGLDSKLKLAEVGPFTYQEIRKNDNLELDLESKLIRYSPNIRTRFLPDKSVARPEDVNVTMPNLAMLSMASKVSSFGFLPRLGYNLLTSRLQSKAIVRMSAKDYLWGYDEPLIRLGNNLMPGFVNFDVLGILDRLYDKKAKYVYELSADNNDKFSIRTVNGSGGLDMWGYKDPKKRTVCNSFTNTYEGIGYPPEMTSARSIRIYRTVLCRILELDYHGTTMTSYGVEGLEYRISNRTYSRNEETECLCNYGNCMEGVSDLSPCFLGLPIVLSNAHFLHTDPKLYERIEGMKPDVKRHGSSFLIEPKVGIVLDTQFSVQVNLLVRDVRFNAETSRFSDMLIPVVYFEIKQPPLVPKQVFHLDLLYFIGPGILLSVQILLAVTALGLLGYAVALVYWNWMFSDSKRISLHSELRGKRSIEAPLMR